MTYAKHLTTSGLLAGAILALTGQAAQAQETFINPDWANSAWYVGAGIGQSRAKVDQDQLVRSLTANGATLSSFTSDQRDAAYKLYVGKQLNPYFALEGGYFDLGKFSFNSATSGNGVLNGETGFRGINLDLIGQLPLSERFSVYGRVGMNYARTSTSYRGNRLIAGPSAGYSERKLGAKAGLGLEYKFSEALALRGEVERYRVNDAVGHRGDVDLLSLNLVYKLGRPATRAVVYAEPAAPAPTAMPAPVIVVAPAPVAVAVPVSEKVSFAAEALFDFDKALVKPQGKAALDDLLLKLQGMNTEVMITVGHTDSVGPEVYNQKLSLRRADAVKVYLVSKGVEANRVYTEGKGKTQPLADNSTAEGRAKNRRVTVEVVGMRSSGK